MILVPGGKTPPPFVAYYNAFTGEFEIVNDGSGLQGHHKALDPRLQSFTGFLNGLNGSPVDTG